MARRSFRPTQTAYFRRMNWTNYCPACRADRVVMAFERRTLHIAADTSRLCVRGRCSGCDSVHSRFDDERHTFDVQYSFRALQDGLLELASWLDNNGHSELARVMNQQRENESE